MSIFLEECQRVDLAPLSMNNRSLACERLPQKLGSKEVSVLEATFGYPRQYGLLLTARIVET